MSTMSIVEAKRIVEDTMARCSIASPMVRFSKIWFVRMVRDIYARGHQDGVNTKLANVLSSEIETTSYRIGYRDALYDIEQAVKRLDFLVGIKDTKDK